MKTNDFDYLVDALKSLPSIGTKVAERIAYFLLKQDQEYIDTFINRIIEFRKKTFFCLQCNNLTNKVGLCEICSNHSRNQKSLCIIGNVEDLSKIENTNVYYGLYFVLNELINVKTNKNISKEQVKKITDLCSLKQFNEIIFATDFTPDGEATALFLKKVISNILPNTQFFRLAIGLPINSAIDYADTYTLKSALKNKIKY